MYSVVVCVDGAVEVVGKGEPVTDGDGAGEGVTEGVGENDAVGFGVGEGISAPLFQTSFPFLLIQVNFIPLEILVMPDFAHFLPDCGAPIAV